MAFPDWLTCSREEGCTIQLVTKSQIFVLAQQRLMLNPPLGETFVVNSEPRLCAGLIKEGIDEAACVN
jgi:hypothetical protein